MTTLSAAQRRVVEEIDRFKAENGYSPSVRELGAALGFASIATVHHHLTVLEQLGAVSREPHKPRTIVVNHEENTDAAPLEDQPDPAS